MKMPGFELERYFARHEFGAPYLGYSRHTLNRVPLFDTSTTYRW